MDIPPTVDRAALDRLVEWGGDKLLRQMLRLFLENSEERLNQMEAALGTGGDLDVLHRGAHSLKSSAANVGALQMSAVAGRLEAIAQDGDPSASRALFDELTERFGEAATELRRVLEGSPS